MDFFIFFTIFSSVFLLTKAHEPNNTSYGRVYPGIRYPFRIQDEQPHHSGHPGFELFFRQNKTYIHFPTYGDLIVKTISYDTRKLNLIDPKNCVPDVFLNLNLSLTPFSYYYVLKEYTYINCSSHLSTSFVQVPCLSGLNHHVYIVETSISPPISCNFVKTVAIPFSYSPYLSDNSFGLSFTWNLTGECDDAGIGCQSETLLHNKGLFGVANDKVIGLIAFIFLAVTLFYAKMALHKVFDLVKEKEKLGEIKVGKVLGEYEALNPATVSKSDIKVLIH
ncbi:RING/U-box superfamily protein [Abeliophyllum distichum]|uniref:RING-type E3 ubiquitin transferase n=1 Tax=Abeliophyllum distichum TaxID=126358 RepID=A0ABD1QBK5_9LAMI